MATVITGILVLLAVVVILGAIAIFVLGGLPAKKPKLSKSAKKMVQDRAEKVKLDSRTPMYYSGSTYRTSSYSKPSPVAKPVKRRENDSTYVAADSDDDYVYEPTYTYDNTPYSDPTPSYDNDSSSSSSSYDSGSSSSSYDSGSSSYDSGSSSSSSFD